MNNYIFNYICWNYKTKNLIDDCELGLCLIDLPHIQLFVFIKTLLNVIWLESFGGTSKEGIMSTTFNDGTNNLISYLSLISGIFRVLAPAAIFLINE